MFKSQKAVFITAIVLYVAYIYGFGWIFDLDYSLIFYVLAGMTGIGFYAFSSDYYPKTEAQKMKKSPSDGSRYIEDRSYALASVGAMLMLLLSITPLLVTIYLNQSGNGHVMWIFQGLIFLGGYALQFVTLAMYKSCGSISIAGELSVGRIYRPLDSATTMDDVMSILNETDKIFVDTRLVESRKEARAIVATVLHKVLRLNPGDFSDGSLLVSDLGARSYEYEEIDYQLQMILMGKYGIKFLSLKHYPKENNVYDNYLRYSKEVLETDDRERFIKKLMMLLRTVKDYYDLVEGMIYCCKMM